MSRAYRIRVAESLNKTIQAEDSVCTQIESYVSFAVPLLIKVSSERIEVPMVESSLNEVVDVEFYLIANGCYFNVSEDRV